MNQKRPNTTVTTPTPKPGLTSKVLSFGAKVGERIAEESIDALSEYFELDPNRTAADVVERLSNKLSNISSALETPAGKRLLRNVGDVGEKVVESLEEPLKTAQNIGNEFITSEVEALEKAGLDAVGVLPVIGEVMEGVRTGSDLVRAAENVADVGAKMTGVGTGVIETIGKEKKRVKDIYDQFSTLAETGNRIQRGGAATKKYKNILRRVTRSKNIFLGGRRKTIRHRRKVRVPL